MERAPQRGEPGVGGVRTYERDAAGQTVGSKRRGYRERREIEQVHEVGVDAQSRVVLSRLGESLFDAVNGGSSRYDQNVDGIPNRRSFAAQCFEPVEAAERG